MININTSIFNSDIEDIVYMKDVTYIDAVVEWSKNNNYDIDYAAELVNNNPIIKSKIEIEAQNLGVIKKSLRLPI